MPRLPSGIDFCIDSQPFRDLIGHLIKKHGLFLSDYLQIQTPDDLRRYLRIIWILPLGADCATHPQFASLATVLRTRRVIVDSGYTMGHLPEFLDYRDRHALSLFWGSPVCRKFQGQLLGLVDRHRTRLRQSVSAENRFVEEWFRPQQREAVADDPTGAGSGSAPLSTVGPVG